MPALIIESGDSPHRAFEFEEDIIIGRGSTPDFAILDSKISRRHAMIERRGANYYVSDMGSVNGTRVNDARIAAPTALKDGDRIQLGRSRLKFTLPEAAHEAGTSVAVSFRAEQADRGQQVLDALETEEGIATLLTGVSGDDALATARKRLEIVFEVSDAIGEVLDEGKLLSIVMRKLFEVFAQAERGFIMLTEDGGDGLDARVALTRSGDPAEIAVSRTLVRDAIDNRRGILTADAMGDERFSDAESVTKLKLRSVVCVPMIAGKQVLGIIHLDGARHPFTRDDMAVLAGIARQAALSLANARQHERLLRQERMEDDLVLARKIQKHFLPGRPPRIPGFEFASVYRAALEVGGDYFDFLNLPDGRIGIAVGDVSGKGVSAALCMAKLSSEARYIASGKNDPAAILTELNAALYRDFTEGMFVTLVFMLLDPATGRLTLANAGHLHPFLCRANGLVETMDIRPHPPLGVLEDVTYPERRFELRRGDTVISCTDGVNEAFSTSGEQFGEERILETLEGTESVPQRALAELLQAVEKFQGTQPQSDDLTIVGFGPAT